MGKILFYCEFGEIKEIGTGHYWRSSAVAKELKRRGHQTDFVKDDIIINDFDVIVIDHLYSKRDILLQAKSIDMKVILIDGQPEDVIDVDASISAFYNPKAQYSGLDYMAFFKCPVGVRYKSDIRSKSVFIGMGGFDANNLAELILPVIAELGLNAIVAKSINHPNFRDTFGNIEVFKENNYYDAMHECVIGITNGGLTMFQALHYGLPCVALPQYEHQGDNIDRVSHCCVTAERNIVSIKNKIMWLLESEYRRESMSCLARSVVDGKGCERICAIIEGML